MSELKTILDGLSKPFENLQWRVQSAGVKKDKAGKITRQYAACVAYIDARDAAERLDEVVPGAWQSDYKEVAGQVYCGIGIKIEGEWLWRWDTGSAGSIEEEKSLASDSFKRAAVKWGINRDAYRLKLFMFNKVKQTGVNYKKEPTYSPVGDGDKLLRYPSDLSAYINKRINRTSTDKVKTLLGADLDGIKSEKDLNAYYTQHIKPVLSAAKTSLNG